MIRIKGKFGDWKEVSKEKAIDFASKFFTIGSKVGVPWEKFDNHIYGVTYEDMRSIVDPFYEKSTRGAGSTKISGT